MFTFLYITYFPQISALYNTPKQKCKNIVKCKLTYRFSFHGKKFYH